MTRRLHLLALLGATLLAPALVRADLTAVMAEKKLTKRARKALEHADAMLDAARDAYLAGDRERTAARLAELVDSVRLAYDSLKETGKPPRKLSNHYKRAEIGTRKLLRRLDTFRDEMSYLDRNQLDKVIPPVQKIHDELLNDIMGGGRR